jgi:uncharacterized membrane protein
MSHKNVLTLVAVAALVTFAALAVYNQFWGIPVKNIVVGIFTSALYAMLIVAFVLRFALILLGVFAIYRVIQERHQNRLTA